MVCVSAKETQRWRRDECVRQASKCFIRQVDGLEAGGMGRWKEEMAEVEWERIRWV